MKRFILTTLIILVSFILIIGIEVFYATRGKVEEFKNPSADPIFFGQSGEEMTYIVLGDSTSAGQGADYENGIAISSAKYLGEKFKVKMYNFSISGATTEELRRDQLPKALEYKADFILISIGSNDVTAFNSSTEIKKNMNIILDKLLEKNCNAKIIITGAADVGSSPRFLQPLSFIVSARVRQINNTVFSTIAVERDLILAPIAKETGPVFKKDRSLFSSDRYHPNNEGYEVWNKVIREAIDRALEKRLSDQC